MAPGTPEEVHEYEGLASYRCINGSQFDTSDDGEGDTLTVTLKCQWNKMWDPPELPECKVTHCVNPIVEPLDGAVNLVEATDQWTEVGKFKRYNCLDGMKIENNTATKGAASDHAIVECLDDGSMEYPEPWPQCSPEVFCGQPPHAPVETFPLENRWTMNATSDSGTIKWLGLQGNNQGSKTCGIQVLDPQRQFSVPLHTATCGLLLKIVIPNEGSTLF